MADPLAIELAPAAARTASGSGTAADIGERRSALKLVLDVTAASGAAPQLTVGIETSVTGAGGWKSAGAFPMATGDGPVDLVVAGCRRFVRATWTISGTTPSFTFRLSGEAHVLYASPSQLARYGAPAAALEDLSDEVVAGSCLSATDQADSCLARRYTLPLVSWPDELTKNCAILATADAMAVRGHDVSGPDELVLLRAKDADRWLQQVGAGTRSPPGIIDSTPTKHGAAPRVSNRSTRRLSGRGWHEDDC